MSHAIFVTGGTGYIGSRLIPLLIQRDHRVKALIRRGSERKVPVGAETVIGDALELNSYTKEISPADTFVHLIGVPYQVRPKPDNFRRSTWSQSGLRQKPRAMPAFDILSTSVWNSLKCLEILHQVAFLAGRQFCSVIVT